jgi:hypothetical protein
LGRSLSRPTLAGNPHEQPAEKPGRYGVRQLLPGLVKIIPRATSLKKWQKQKLSEE